MRCGCTWNNKKAPYGAPTCIPSSQTSTLNIKREQYQVSYKVGDNQTPIVRYHLILTKLMVTRFSEKIKS